MKKLVMRSAVMFALVAAMGAVETQAQQAAQKPNPLAVSFQNLTAARDSARARVQASSAQALPNDTLRYVLTFTNHEGRGLTNVVFTNPIPSGLLLVGGTVTTSAAAKVEYSIDDGATFDEQPMVLITENGRQVRRPARPETYTHIRWTVTDSVAPNARVTARYDARVSTTLR